MPLEKRVLAMDAGEPSSKVISSTLFSSPGLLITTIAIRNTFGYNSPCAHQNVFSGELFQGSIIEPAPTWAKSPTFGAMC